jgi:NAD(P)-dependent dehydrogenase (short-subunit alcohol dehydrogenase family)
MSRPLDGRVAVVTGASREIGATIAARLAADGARVVLSHHAEAALAESHAEAIRAAGGDAVAIEADLSQVAPCAGLVTATVARYGRVDYMIANAGVTIFKPFLETQQTEYDFLFNLNVRGAFFCAQAAAKQMVAQGGGGRIVFSSSVAGIRGAAGLPVYGVTKAALRHMARTLGAELGPLGITVNAIGIGATLNERNLKIDPNYEQTWARITPVGRVMYPTDIANAVRFIVDDTSSGYNGQTMVVDGGWAMGGKTP